MSAAQSVLELSRSVLAGRRGVVVVLEVYIDESGIHDRSPVVIVAAYAAQPEQWATFTQEWIDAIKPAIAWHATDASACKRGFKGWTQEQVAAAAERALPLIPKHVESGLAIGIQMEDFEEALHGRPELREILGTPYGACLHWLMATILKERAEAGNTDQVAFFHETNEYRGEALETFAHMEKAWNGNSSSHFTRPGGFRGCCHGERLILSLA